MKAVTNSLVLIALSSIKKLELFPQLFSLNLPTLGTVRLLISAKQNRLIPNLKEQLYNWQIVGKFCLSLSVYENALQKVSEL
ncbi:conserved hypothetical protein [Microcystis aeruginosa PCC 9807]|uniref:Uncharacterized protein n=1 Tax=Microcystis aeruginosa PCC 9807 TaxID=1160283 RepID=I4HA42_MICAE|nr:hypothetical protein [Microcystis aeruginosa]CCI18916.1 conserved hypothetical protein [Microcystis aeruginosa PCC 9807]